MSDVLGDELHLADSCPAELRRLVKETLLPLLASRGSSHDSIRPVWRPSESSTFIPLIVTSNGDVLAAIYRTPRVEEVWWLPVQEQDAGTFDFAAWIRAAVDAWHLVDPDRFPGPPDWSHSTDWMTAEELQLSDAVQRAQSELEQAYAKLQAAVDLRMAALSDAQVRHDAAERLLLTAQGDELVAAVMSMLERVGFDVEDCDETRAGQKLEDLRVRDPESSWVALAEVKGHLNAGGKPSEITKISRFVGIYEGQTGSLPDASWYVVNQYASKPPDRRRQLMSGHSEDVETFADELNGVVIDTRDLFVLDRRVATNEMTKQEAREILMGAKSRIQLAPPDGAIHHRSGAPIDRVTT